MDRISGFRWAPGQVNRAHAYLLPRVEREVLRHVAARGAARRIFDLGFGDGSAAGHFGSLGFEVVGVDPSDEGIALANANYPGLRLERGSAYDDLRSRYGTFPVVLSLEVVEHVYAPREFAATLYGLVEPGGVAIVSTPYHGYWKNLALALSGRLDDHFTALWDHGHIKFWSMATLSVLLEEAGFQAIRYHRVGRIGPLAKSMIAVARKW